MTKQSDRYSIRKGWMNWRAHKKLWTLRASGETKKQFSKGYRQHIRKQKSALRRSNYHRSKPV